MRVICERFSLGCNDIRRTVLGTQVVFQCDEAVDGFSEPPFVPALINADITEDHVLLAERDGCWGISGLIDFGNAMMGHPYYDFAAPLAFYTFGRPSLSRTLVEAYGLELTDEGLGF